MSAELDDFPFSREFRVYGWKRIIEHCEEGDDDLKEMIQGELDADKSYKETTGLQLGLEQWEADRIDAIAKKHGIDPNHIPDMGLDMAIRGTGIQHKKDE